MPRLAYTLLGTPLYIRTVRTADVRSSSLSQAISDSMYITHLPNDLLIPTKPHLYMTQCVRSYIGRSTRCQQTCAHSSYTPASHTATGVPP